MVGEMSLPNVSGMDVDLGDLTFNGSVADIVIANMSVSNALLLRGNNTVPFQGQLFIDTILANLGTILGNSTTLSGGNFNMLVKDGQSVVGGQHIPWVESVLAHSPLQAAVPLTQLLQSALGSVIGSTTASSTSGITNRLVERLLQVEDVDVESVSGQARSGLSWTALPLKPQTGDLLGARTSVDVLKAARLYQRLRSKQNG
ncbi:hypothetical protein N0V93_010216 [Gnomoniopsis smithogilvyi]|uniref:Uncharacterized protein n=1 Tax=Gnomoniopsis smithogilvyi TaxID=1191159 RepID=A0A9W8YIT0_9PEZI|nr:hypothetical protein N0V93_010216 [Gnomoniopsis smithogilvyi]